MNTADKAIGEIRAVRHRISAAQGHDIGKYLARLHSEEDQHPTQLEQGRVLWRGGARKARNSLPSQRRDGVA